MTVRPLFDTVSDRPQECVGLTHWTQCEPLKQSLVIQTKDHFKTVSVVKLRLEKAIANSDEFSILFYSKIVQLR